MQQTDEASAVAAHRVVAPRSVIVIGAGSGGPAALANVIPKLPSSFSAAAVVLQQMRPGFIRLLASYLSNMSGIQIEEAQQRQALKPSQALIAPGCHGLTISRTEAADKPFMIRLEDQTDSVAKTRSRIDAAMKSAAELFGPQAIGVLLTGAGSDGRDGMKAIRDAGGVTIAQDQDSSLLFDMPRAAIEAGVVDEVLPLWSISDRLMELMGE